MFPRYQDWTFKYVSSFAYLKHIARRMRSYLLFATLLMGILWTLRSSRGVLGSIKHVLANLVAALRDQADAVHRALND